ncbi:MAG: O-antigen ligase family protein [Marinilabiliaceae bacterium]|nr:O-antigen ligase family protein [Marinilabiliaceae bacterium]
MIFKTGKIATTIPAVYAVVSLLALSGVFLTPLMVDNELHDPTRMGKIFFFTRYMLILLPVGLIAFVYNRKQAVSLQTVLIILWLAWIVIRGKTGGIWHDEKFFWWSGCFAFYFISRQLVQICITKQYDFLIYFPVVVIAIIALVESVMGLFQIFGIAPIYNSEFKVTGTFFNPAPYAGFLVASLPWCLYLTLLKKEKLIYKIMSAVGVLSSTFVIIILPSTRSRSAFLGCFAILVIWCFNRYKPFDRIKKHIDTTLKRAVAISLSLSIVITLALGLYHFKKDSANGRLLVWKIAVLTIKEKPLLGHGFNTMQATLAPAQADYFASGNADPQESLLASNVKWAFNEFLQTTSEYGLVGLFLFLLVIIFSMYQYKSSNTAKMYTSLMVTARASLIGIIIFSCFSYPFYSLPIVILLFFSISQLGINDVLGSNIRIFAITINNITVVGILLCVLGFYLLKTNSVEKGYWMWDEANKLYSIKEYQEACKSYEEAKELLPNNGLLIQQYAKCLSMNGNATFAKDILLKNRMFYTDEFSYIILGDCYSTLDDYTKAENNYKKAMNLIPYKVYSKYQLFQLYMKTEQTDKLTATAKLILNQTIKVDSKASKKIKQHIKDLMKKTKENRKIYWKQDSLFSTSLNKERRPKM